MLVLLIAFTSSSALAKSGQDVEKWLINSFKHKPKDHSRVLKTIVDLGEDALPSLVKALQYKKLHHNSLYFICTVANKLHNEKVKDLIQPHLLHQKWIVVSSCSRTYGFLLAKYSYTFQEIEYLENIMLASALNGQCHVAISAAEGIGFTNDPSALKIFSTWLMQGNKCQKEAALRGYMTSDEQDFAGEMALRIVSSINESDFHSTAWVVLRDIGYEPALDIARSTLNGRDPGNNIYQFCLQLMKKIGDKSDIPLLRKVIKSDPYDGAGVQAVYARKAIRSIKKRFKSS